jgi:hypothetical protein
MEEAVHQANYLAEALVGLLGAKLCDASKDALHYLAIQLEDRVDTIREDWRRAHAALHPE